MYLDLFCYQNTSLLHSFTLSCLLAFALLSSTHWLKFNVNILSTLYCIYPYMYIALYGMYIIMFSKKYIPTYGLSNAGSSLLCRRHELNEELGRYRGGNFEGKIYILCVVLSGTVVYVLWEYL